MGNPRITFDGANLDFTQPASPGWELRPFLRRSLDFTDGKKHAAQLLSIFYRGRLQVEKFTDADFERKILSWWSWASRGNEYAVALDSEDQIDTTLDGSAAPAATVIPLTSTTGIVVGGRYRISEAAGHEMEEIEVQSISAGVSVTITVGLKYGYASGDLFRSRDYLPKAVNLDEEPPWKVATATTWTFDHRFQEVS